MSQAVFEKIIKLLDRRKISYQVFEHEPVFTSQQAAQIRGTKPEQGAKALIFLGDSRPLMVVLPGSRKVETKIFKQLFAIRNLCLATAEQVEKITNGVRIGAVPPFGNLFEIPVFVDRSLGVSRQIAFNAGLHTKSIKMKYKDFVRLVNPIFGEFSELS